MRFIILFLFSALCFSAFAEIIGTSSKPGEESNVCKIMFRNKKGRLLSTCSGVLVAATKILTAKHCLQKAPSVSVECGFLGSTDEVLIEQTNGGAQARTQGLKFKEFRTDVKSRVGFKDDKKDFAVIEFETPIAYESIKPAKFEANGINEYFINIGLPHDGPYPPQMRDDSECKMEGFGIDNEGLSGILVSAPVDSILTIDQSKILSGDAFEINQIPPKGQRPLKSCFNKYSETLLPRDLIPLVKKMTENKMFGSAITPGDSGGPFLCRKKGTTEWSVVGIATNSSIELNRNAIAGAVSTWQVLDLSDWLKILGK